jgi:hypothetical protein
MSNGPIAKQRCFHEGEVAEKFLEAPNDDSFPDLFNAVAPQLVAERSSRIHGRENLSVLGMKYV